MCISYRPTGIGSLINEMVKSVVILIIWSRVYGLVYNNLIKFFTIVSECPLLSISTATSDKYTNEF